MRNGRPGRLALTQWLRSRRLTGKRPSALASRNTPFCALASRRRTHTPRPALPRRRTPVVPATCKAKLRNSNTCPIVRSHCRHGPLSPAPRHAPKKKSGRTAGIQASVGAPPHGTPGGCTCGVSVFARAPRPAANALATATSLVKEPKISAPQPPADACGRTAYRLHAKRARALCGPALNGRVCETARQRHG